MNAVHSFATTQTPSKKEKILGFIHHASDSAFWVGGIITAVSVCFGLPLAASGQILLAGVGVGAGLVVTACAGLVKDQTSSYKRAVSDQSERWAEPTGMMSGILLSAALIAGGGYAVANHLENNYSKQSLRQDFNVKEKNRSRIEVAPYEAKAPKLTP